MDAVVPSIPDWVIFLDFGVILVGNMNHLFSRQPCTVTLGVCMVVSKCNRMFPMPMVASANLHTSKTHTCRFQAALSHAANCNRRPKCPQPCHAYVLLLAMHQGVETARVQSFEKVGSLASALHCTVLHQSKSGARMRSAARRSARLVCLLLRLLL